MFNILSLYALLIEWKEILWKVITRTITDCDEYNNPYPNFLTENNDKEIPGT